jgi:hypothetical protein
VIECVVSQPDATQWLGENRPEIALMLQCRRAAGMRPHSYPSRESHRCISSEPWSSKSGLEHRTTRQA